MNRRAKVYIYEGIGGEWRFQLRDTNGEIISHGEGYATEHNAIEGYLNVRKETQNAVVMRGVRDDETNRIVAADEQPQKYAGINFELALED